ncbi:DEAD/DEAH box helicase [Psychrilyobacter sp.]|uniref:DEAD/DEAH box helicase n=1 Tax=Psychrilyobacter sp. TaxID=2586924 RepID=UPI0030179D8B
MKISNKEIKKIAGDISNYNRGLKCSKDNLCEIENIDYEWDELEIKFDGLAHGTELYNFDIRVSINLNEMAVKDRIIDYNCDCPAFSKYERACKHIVGGLLVINKDGYLKEIEEQVLATNNYNTPLEVDDIEGEYSKGFMSFEDEGFAYNNSIKESKEEKLLKTLKNYMKNLEKKRENPEKLELNVEYNIEREEIYNYAHILKIKIGIHGKRKYVMKDIIKFIDSYKEDKILEFGKEFKFLPDKHKLTEYDYKLLNELSRMCKITNEYLFEHNGYYAPHVNKAKINLSNEWFKILLENMSGKENINLNSSKMMLGSFEKEQFISFDSKYIGVEPYSLLTADGKYIATKTKIYLIAKQDRELIKILYETALLYNGLISVETELGGKLKTLVAKADFGVIEVLEKAGESIIFIDENKDHGDILAIDINVSYEKETLIDGKKYLLKEDIKKTSKIFKEITGIDQKIDFNTSLHGEEEVLEFFINKLPKLNKKYNIQIDEKLNKIKPKTVSIHGSIVRSGELLEITFNADGISEEDLKSIQLGLLSKKKYVKLSDDGIINLADKKLKELEGILAELDKGLGTQEISEFTVSKLGLISPNLNLKNIGDLKIERLLKILKKDKIEIMPKNIDASLRCYQKEGYDWMKKLHDSRLGGILADDMGLGKTLQAITLLTKIHSNKGVSIVIAPTSLTHNWLKEIKKFSPKLNAVIIEGTPKERTDLLNNFKNGVILTSYGSFRKDIEIYENIEFLTAILDEAQHIKNNGTLIKKAVKKIKSSSRFALTGTPIENSIFELWSIFDFVIPTYLHNKEKFKNKYGKKIDQEMDGNSLINLKKMIKPFILRRTKLEVLKELPEKIETNMILGMDSIQKKYYLSYLSQFKGELEECLEEDGFNKSRIKILALLTRLRQICCTPELFIENYKGRSTKVEALLELLEEFKSSGHRVLVFSQFVKTFEIIKKQLDPKKITYFQIDGSTQAKKRLTMCDDFNDGEKDIFLISLKAGGSGLNLTGADVVIHFDPWWNPAVEVQATDRAHRIGQDKVVQVIKFITEGTIEEKIIKIQENKSKLINFMVDGDGKIEKLTKNDILGLFE